MIQMNPVPKKETTETYTGRCMRCRVVVTIQNPVKGINARNVNYVKGNCGTCNTIVFRILPKTK